VGGIFELFVILIDRQRCKNLSYFMKQSSVLAILLVQLECNSHINHCSIACHWRNQLTKDTFI